MGHFISCFQVQGLEDPGLGQAHGRNFGTPGRTRLRLLGRSRLGPICRHHGVAAVPRGPGGAPRQAPDPVLGHD